MAEVCRICGLPLDLCVCGEISREQQRIRVRVETRRYGREVTIIEGIEEKEPELAKIASKLKSSCACGGTVKENAIILQGDHRNKIKRLLARLGFPEENIEIR
jgi:translation initiation factor 1